MSNTFLNHAVYEITTKSNRTARQETDDRTLYGAKKMQFGCRVSKKIITNVVIFNSYCFRLDESLRLGSVANRDPEGYRMLSFFTTPNLSTE